MSGHNFIVPARSWNTIEQIALSWRSKFGLNQTAYTPIMEIMEGVLDNVLGLVTVLSVEKAEMGPAEGLTDPNGEFIELREDVFDGACRGNARDRFTAAHELGHFILHTKIPLARAGPGQTIKPYCLSEPQANQFASEILMPATFFSRLDTPEAVMSRHGVSFQAANVRLDYLRRKGRI